MARIVKEIVKVGLRFFGFGLSVLSAANDKPTSRNSGEKWGTRPFHKAFTSSGWGQLNYLAGHPIAVRTASAI